MRVCRSEGRNKQNLIERKLADGGLRDGQVPEMYWIECAPEDTEILTHLSIRLAGQPQRNLWQPRRFSSRVLPSF